MGITGGENGAEYWLGRGTPCAAGTIRENTQVIFDPDPDGEEPMGVPREIELAPEEYSPSDEDYRPRRGGGGGAAEEERSQADQAKVEAGQAIAERRMAPGTAAPRERSSRRGARRRTPTGRCRDRRRCSAAPSSICTASRSR